LSPDDPIDAARLGLRLAALGRVLDDLPRHANRFARWRARLDRDRRSDSAFQEAEGRANPMVRRGQVRRGVTPRTMRIWPLRPGRPACGWPATNSAGSSATPTAWRYRRCAPTRPEPRRVRRPPCDRSAIFTASADAPAHARPCFLRGAHAGQPHMSRGWCALCDRSRRRTAGGAAQTARRRTRLRERPAGGRCRVRKTTARTG
jgi:hypothetical protein